jgi:hypothetical protein
MTPAEEHSAFYASIGFGVTQWAHLENSLCALFRACLGGERKWATATFYAVENFRAKMQMTDTLIRLRVPKGDLLAEWSDKGGFFQRLTAQSKIRNKLAHYTVLIFPDAKPGRRYHLQPNCYDPANPKVDPDRPQGGLFVSDLKQIPFGFSSLFVALDQYAGRVQALLAQPPEPSPPARHRRSTRMPKTPKRATL